MNPEFVSAGLTAAQLNAIVEKLGGHEGALRFLQGELPVPESARRWREQHGVIRFSVTSDGTTGPQWITRLEEKGFQIKDDVKSVLCSPVFKPTNGVTTEIAVLRGVLFKDNVRITSTIRAEADRRGLTMPNAEVACLLRDMFTDEEIEFMNLWSIVTMHEPIEDSHGWLILLFDTCYDNRLLLLETGDPDYCWRSDYGFAFVDSRHEFTVPPPLPSRAWREQHGVIRFSVTSDGTTGPQWITRLERKGCRITRDAKSVLCASAFKPTNDVTTEIAVLKWILFEGGDQTHKKIRMEADRRGLSTPNVEVACLLRDTFTDEEIQAMGLWWIITMHEPIEDSTGALSLLRAGWLGGGHYLAAISGNDEERVFRNLGYAFAVLQGGPHT
jgi:hypothetical protein